MRDRMFKLFTEFNEIFVFKITAEKIESASDSEIKLIVGGVFYVCDVVHTADTAGVSDFDIRIFHHV